MPLQIQIKTEGKLKRLSGEIHNRIGAALRQELPGVAREIVARTQSGVDSEGRGFAAYSSAYAASKRKALGSSSPVNLTYTGSMLDSIRVRVTGGLTGPVEGRIEVTDPKAEYHQSGTSGPFGVPARPFFGLDRAQITRIVNAIRNALTR